MDGSPKESLGQVVRDLRERKGLTQVELGREAGYGKGAGVSISRLESGLLRPGPERFAGIARALGLEPEELDALAAENAIEDEASAVVEAGSAAGAWSAGPTTARGFRNSKELRERARRIQYEIDERTTAIKRLGDEFNRQHDRARDEFFMRFVQIAARVEDAPTIDASPFADDETADPGTVASYRFESNAKGMGHLLAGGLGGAAAGAAVGSAAAYGAFVATASFGTASTGAAISGLSGVAATNATLAALGGGTLAAGGAGVAGGTMLLAGLVAAPAAILFAGGLLWMAKRTRRQQQELAAQLDDAHDQLVATQPGYEALKRILPRAAEILDYIATHAGHALNRWENQLGPGPMSWESLGHETQQRYQSFVEIAAAQLTIVTINVQGVLTTHGSDQEQLILLADEVLSKSENVVKAHV